METITITLKTIPIPQKRPRFFRRGMFCGAYNPQEKEKAYYKTLINAQVNQSDTIASHHLPLPQGIPIAIGIAFFLPIPTSFPKGKQRLAINGELMHTNKPDLDNLVKFILDTGSGILWNDDDQIVNITATKQYGTEPCIILTITY